MNPSSSCLLLAPNFQKEDYMHVNPDSAGGSISVLQPEFWDRAMETTFRRVKWSQDLKVNFIR
jgi:hypothetical protein